MNVWKTAPIVAAALAVTAAVPVMAAGHGHSPANLPSQAVAHAVSTTSNGVAARVSQASSVASKSSTAVPSHVVSLPKQATSHAHGQSSQVLADVEKMHALIMQVKTARQQYVAAIRAYLQGLSQTVSTGSATGMQQALTQLQTIKTTLAQTVQTVMAAQHAQATMGGQSGPTALSNVIAKFQAELAALVKATAQVKALTTTVSTSPSTAPSTGSSTSPSTSTSTAPSTSPSASSTASSSN
ncbi:MAG: hypothetical protein C7B44_13870 [Sulfobacillus thermosulfidooxidans]|nr:MAG: hypothetical protein C7B44_13870 [Sulfobacillus thermosulfidooxidans]